jgi:hypothetical protein
MLCMTHDSDPSPPDPSPPSDVCLLLRAHAEQRWLSLEVNPVLRQLQQRDFLPEEQLGAALAYLEVLWIDASQRAAETDAAFAQLDACERAATNGAARPQPGASHADRDRTLHSKARRYHVAVLTLRDVIARQVLTLIATPSDIAAREHASS